MEEVILLGEGTFHQMHDGVATGARARELEEFSRRWHEQYLALRGQPWAIPRAKNPPTYLGTMPRPALARFVRAAIEPLPDGLNGQEPLGAQFDRDLWSSVPIARPQDATVAALVNLAHTEWRASRAAAPPTSQNRSACLHRLGTGCKAKILRSPSALSSTWRARRRSDCSVKSKRRR